MNNFVTFSGGFGSVSVGERFECWSILLSRMTATVAENVDGASISKFLFIILI